MANRLDIWECRTPRNPNSLRFRILETYPCVDGYRTRITHEAFSTMEEAEHFIEQKETEQ